MTPWELEITEFSSCNCNYGCPCQFNAPPTLGHCEAVVGLEVKRGHFGETRLDGLRAVSIMQWPGAIHEGAGKVFLIIDERADQAQRDALLTVFSGGETEPGATVWNVFAATFDQVFDPVFKEIDLAIDVEARTGHVRVEGLAQTSGQPIRNPVTGEEHRARINLPEGFEYTVAEMGASTYKASGPIEMAGDDRYAQFAHLHHNNQGAIRTEAA